MRNLLLVCLLSLSFVACSKSKNSCSPNATVVYKFDSKNKVSEGINEQNQLVLNDGSHISSVGTGTIYADGGGSMNVPMDDSSDEEDGLTIIDFSRKTLSSDGEVISFEKDAELTALKGQNVYRLNDAEIKAKLQPILGEMNNDDLKACSVQDAAYTFSFDDSSKIATSNVSVAVRVQILNQKTLEYLKAGGY